MYYYTSLRAYHLFSSVKKAAYFVPLYAFPEQCLVKKKEKMIKNDYNKTKHEKSQK